MQIFPNTDSVMRLVGALLVEINDGMIAAERRYIAAASIAPVLENDDRLPSRSTPYLTTDRTAYTGRVPKLV